MKKFKVILRDRPSKFVEAETYRREGEQYVFDKQTSSEVDFFDANDVAGIIEVHDRNSNSIAARGPFLSELLP